MGAKTVFATLVGFLGHHAADLDSVSTALSDILSAVPVNAETRSHINAVITRIKTSAENVANAVQDFAGQEAPEPVTIRESDIETALRNVLAAGALDKAISDAVAAYQAKNPGKAVPLDQNAVAVAVEEYLADHPPVAATAGAPDDGAGASTQPQPSSEGKAPDPAPVVGGEGSNAGGKAAAPATGKGGSK